MQINLPSAFGLQITYIWTLAIYCSPLLRSAAKSAAPQHNANKFAFCVRLANHLYLDFSHLMFATAAQC
ncbi:MAG: hypothetical protein J6K74_00615, partial [Marinifilaceae bacterium]|nr:hypothetical protein [Marinifilaceae bacterium]